MIALSANNMEQAYFGEVRDETFVDIAVVTKHLVQTRHQFHAFAPFLSIVELLTALPKVSIFFIIQNFLEKGTIKVYQDFLNIA